MATDSWRAFAFKIDSLISRCNAIERFRAMVKSNKATRSYVPLDGKASLEEKYTALAVIHDIECDGSERVAPWGWDEATGFPCRSDDDASSLYVGSFIAYKMAKGPTVYDLLRYGAFLRDVAADLRQANRDDRKQSKTKLGLVSWTQDELNNAIREYKASHSRQYSEIKEAIEEGKSGAAKAATTVFGRNAIVRALKVKSPPMVGNSPAWIAIAEDLRLPLKRGRATGTRHTRRPGKIGFDMAVEEASLSMMPDSESSDDGKQRETIRLIDGMARLGKTAAQKAKCREYSESLKQKLRNGSCTDDQAREIVATLTNRDFSSKE